MMRISRMAGMARWSVVAGTLGALALLVAACGSDPTATPLPTATPPPAAEPDATPTEGPPAWEVEWEETLALAREEGQVIMALGGTASRNFAPRFEIFEAETGIEVIAAAGGGSTQVTKVTAEREAGLFTTDIWMTGITSTKAINRVGALKDNFLEHIILPDILDVNNWFDGRHWFPIGLEGTAMMYCASPSVAFSYNTELADVSGLTSWWDLVDGRFKGQWVGKFPWESGQTDSELFINNPDLGEAFIRTFMLEQDAEWVADAQQAVDLLAKGVKSIFMPTGNASDDVDSLASLGFPVKNHFAQGFKEGGRLAVGGACAQSLLKDAPHPNAQKVFANWWFTAENLYETGGITNDHSLRTDVATDNLDPNYVRKEGVTYFFPEADPRVPSDNPGLAFNRLVADEAGLR